MGRAGDEGIVLALVLTSLLLACPCPVSAAGDPVRATRFADLYGLSEEAGGNDPVVADLLRTYACESIVADVKVTRRLRCSDKLAETLRDLYVGSQAVKYYEYVHVRGNGTPSDPIHKLLGTDAITLMQLQDPEISPCWIRYDDVTGGRSSLWFAAAGEGAYLVKVDPAARNARTGAELLRPEVLRTEDYDLQVVDGGNGDGGTRVRALPKDGKGACLREAFLEVAPMALDGDRGPAVPVIRAIEFQQVVDGTVLRGKRTYSDFRVVGHSPGGAVVQPWRIVDVQQGTMLGEPFTVLTEVEVERIGVDGGTAEVLKFLERRPQRVRGLAVAVFWIQMEHGKAKEGPTD